MATPKKKNYYEPGDVPQSEITRIKQEAADKEERDAYLKANPSVAPAPEAYKNNDEYLKENEANKERMKRSARYSETLKELENPKKKK